MSVCSRMLPGRMYSYVTRVLLVCTRMYSYVLVCYSYVLVWCFSHDRVGGGCEEDEKTGARRVRSGRQAGARQTPGR